MKTKFVSRARALLWIVLGTLLVGGCGKAFSSSGSGSNTNWLKSCDTATDCSGGAECWCHVCTAPCDDGVACEQAGATCQSSAAIGCGAPSLSASICVASCKTSSDCGALGAGLSCLKGACVGADDSSSDGGSTGSGDSGGSGGVGDGASGAATLLEPDVGVLAMGEQQRCLTTGGRVYCWGGNSYGQAGGDPLRGPEAHLLSEVPSAVEIAAGTYHTCARTSGGDVYCWGKNASGEIGSASAPKSTCPDNVLDAPGDYPCQPTPTRVAAVSGARQIAVGDGRSCAVLGDDSVTCWGDVTDISEWVAGVAAPGGLALGPSGACAITAQGTLSCSNAAPETAALHDLKAVVLSPGIYEKRFACALGTAGDVHCWGDDTYGQLGQPDAAGLATNPINDASQVVVTSGGACALVADGGVWCWGRNSDGEAGLTPLASPSCGAEMCEMTPRRVENVPKATKLSAGRITVCAVAEDSAIWCWGAESQPGSATRMAGPWEGEQQACATAANGAHRAAIDAIFNRFPTDCVSDDDCVDISLDLPCMHTCESVPRTKADRADMLSALADVTHTYCDAAPASCAEHAVTCSPTTDKNVCVDGICKRINLERSGCSDVCICEAERGAANGVYQGDCAGPDLWPIVSMPCKTCGPGGGYFVIGNRGDAAFSGTATLSFVTETPEQAALAPPSQSLELTLAPGEVTAPIYVESRGEVLARVRITGAGDCAPANDASSDVTFPAPRACP